MINKQKKDKPESYYRTKADKLLQELGRQTYSACLVCGDEYSCLHHFIRKSQSTALRYDWENCVPICYKCHTKCHTGQDDSIPGRIVLINGKEWFDKLMEKKKEGIGQRFGRLWFKEKVELLSGLVH